MTAKRILIIGSGKRVREAALPALDCIPQLFEVAAIYARTAKRISVGGVETESLAVVLTNEAIRKQFEDNTPMRRPGTVEDIACMALYLASDAASWVTGKIFQVDGGTEAPAMSVPVEPL